MRSVSQAFTRHQPRSQGFLCFTQWLAKYISYLDQIPPPNTPLKDNWLYNIKFHIMINKLLISQIPAKLDYKVIIAQL